MFLRCSVLCRLCSVTTWRQCNSLGGVCFSLISGRCWRGRHGVVYRLGRCGPRWWHGEWETEINYASQELINTLAATTADWIFCFRFRVHTKLATPRLLHYGPFRHHEHHGYSWSHPVPPNSYQLKSRLSPPLPWKSLHALQTKTQAARSAVNSQNY